MRANRARQAGALICLVVPLIFGIASGAKAVITFPPTHAGKGEPTPYPGVVLIDYGAAKVMIGQSAGLVGCCRNLLQWRFHEVGKSAESSHCEPNFSELVFSIGSYRESVRRPNAELKATFYNTTRAATRIHQRECYRWTLIVPLIGRLLVRSPHLADLQLRPMGSVELIPLEFQLAANRTPLSNTDDSEGARKEGQPQSIVGDRIGKRAIPYSFLQFTGTLVLFLSLLGLQAFMMRNWGSGNHK